MNFDCVCISCPGIKFFTRLDNSFTYLAFSINFLFLLTTISAISWSLKDSKALLVTLPDSSFIIDNSFISSIKFCPSGLDRSILVNAFDCDTKSSNLPTLFSVLSNWNINSLSAFSCLNTSLSFNAASLASCNAEPAILKLA